MMLEKVKKYYAAGVWSEERVRKLVEVGKLSREEYEEVTGEIYNEKK